MALSIVPTLPGPDELGFHPAADSFPMMDADRFADLVEDILRNGQLEPVTLCDGMILDGRNRYRACLRLGISPITRAFDGNPWDFSWSMNGARRDLVDDQRYLIWKHCSEHGAAWLETKARLVRDGNAKRSVAARGNDNAAKERGGKSVGDQTDPALKSVKPERAAKASASNTNRGAVARGDRLARVRPDLAEKVRTGKIKPTEAHRQMKRDEVAGRVAELPAGKFTVIYADPPWKYGDGRTGDHMTATGALDHYPTMTLKEIKALDVQRLAADDSALFLWVTSPLLPEGLDVCRAWGFKYKALFVWDKVKHNLGHYNSVRHELLFVCTRGSCTPEKMKLFDSVQSIEKTKKHSEKPEEFRDIINTLYPSARKIELFRRGKTPKGWSAWGNENV